MYPPATWDQIVMKLMLVKGWCINVAVSCMIQKCWCHSRVKFNLIKLCYLIEPVLVELEYVFICNFSFSRFWTYWLNQLMHIDLYALKNLLDFSSKCYLFSIPVGFVIVTLKYFFSFFSSTHWISKWTYAPVSKHKFSSPKIQSQG